MAAFKLDLTNVEKLIILSVPPPNNLPVPNATGDILPESPQRPGGVSVAV
jgi:hypothetical protein